MYKLRIDGRHFSEMYGGEEVPELDEMFASPGDYPKVFSHEHLSPNVIGDSRRSAIILHSRNPFASIPGCPRRQYASSAPKVFEECVLGKPWKGSTKVYRCTDCTFLKDKDSNKCRVTARKDQTPKRRKAKTPEEIVTWLKTSHDHLRLNSSEYNELRMKLKEEAMVESRRDNELALKKGNVALQEEIRKLREEAKAQAEMAQNLKLQADGKVAVRQAKAEVKLEWERKTAPLTAKIQTLEALESKLKADLICGKMDAAVLEAEYRVLELKLAKAGVVKKDMETMEAEMRVMQLKLQRAEKGTKRKSEIEAPESNRVKVE